MTQAYEKPARWADPALKLFAKQVAFTAPPHDFDAAPSDFIRLAPADVGAHGRMLHLKGYAHALDQRAKNFDLLEEYVECMANNGVDVCGQVGSNWVHAGGKTPQDIAEFCDRMAQRYDTPLHMAGYCLVEACRHLGVERVALNSVYYWPDWRDGLARFLRAAGLDLVYVGNFVDLGLYATQEEVNARSWIFPFDTARESMHRLAERAPDSEAYLINGMPNWRDATGLTHRPVSLAAQIERDLGKPLIASDTALYWRIFKTIEAAPTRKGLGSLLDGLG